MARISEMFPSNFLRAADFETEATLTMSRVEVEEVGMDKEQKPVLYFEGIEKGLILNKTNSSTIADLYGDDTDDWRGEGITLFSALVSFQGKNGPAIRVKAPSKRKAAAASAGGSQKKISAPLPRLDSEGDDIPF